MDVSKKGIALILFGILISMGANIEVLAFSWFIGLPIGFAGLIIVLTDKGNKN